ncbi:hypothetical protein [Burkholderia sp. Ac-20392]|uniref:hypothetical protein n=1 Tax=Burkholderia sp. Ac-20392 TaxID=2703905 RepID=UPI00197F8DEA|nr:hypothetical protein [Burkholderia sp. Ac-20392]MBN3798498.1 hypothetical protein [Burkholderia sp. Ac-20392]
MIETILRYDGFWPKRAAAAKFNVFTRQIERTLLELNREPLPAEVTPGKAYRLS